MAADRSLEQEQPNVQVGEDFAHDDLGVTAIEYALIAALIAVVIITAVTALGTKISTTFTNIAALYLQVDAAVARGRSGA